ncbi:MAG: alanine racemase [Jaaginema sp. PMC 1079.18]|nr:alanine racemase [Jaaginema sp. PMC 1080.18]MEC4852051.1 alanine racemase [Jaaginema sp. PMC 1079.18]MEC4864643.1 alanine racemase [Jaaginema sp. PMC 1078.18]
MLSWEIKTLNQVKTSQNQQLATISQQRAWVEIDAKAIQHNVKALRQILAPRTQLMAVVKADAYGHGAVSVAEIALEAGATWLAVATLQEGIQLRSAGINAPILVLGACRTSGEFTDMVHWQLQPTLCNPRQGALCAETLTQLGESLPVHLNLDTGMSRLGTPWHQGVDFVKSVQRSRSLRLASIYSHFATADDPDRTIVDLQHRRFQDAIAQLQSQHIPLPQLHIANSAATLMDKSFHYDLVRVGLALYGLYPAPHLQPILPLKPALQVKARITQVKTIPPDTGVSYGYKYVSDREMPIAVVGIGYADGIPRNLSNQLKVAIRGQIVPQIGAITMDQLMLDVSSIPDVQPGEVVTLIGQDGETVLTADHWADTLGTISWEILCGFKHRLPRILHD